MTARAAVALLAAVVLAVAACGSTPGSSGDPSSGQAVQPVDLRYTCGQFPFGPELLVAGPGTAETGPSDAAAALRAHLAGDGPDFDFLPDTGWHLVGATDRLAEFVAVGPGVEMSYVSAELNAAGWQVSGWGQCQPRIVLAAGLGAAAWTFDPDAPLPGPETRVLDVLVIELACNSGEPADGRIVGPSIVASADLVLVVFAVRPRPGAHNCPSNPATRVTIDLGAPLGQRALLDGGQLPFGDPTEPRF
jgi:hypothetical protein